MRIHLASTRVRRIRSVYPEISVYALQSGNFCIRCVSGYVWTLVAVYFCIRWRNAHALLTNPLRCPDTNRIRVDGRIRFVYATCGRRYFCIRIKKIADTKISGYVWTGPENKRSACHREREERPSFTIPPPFAHDTLGLVSAPVGTARWLAESQAWKQTLCFPKILKSLLVSYEDIKWEIAHQVLDLILCPQNLISKLKGQ